MHLDNFIDVFLARHVSCTYAHHQEHYMLSCIDLFWMGGRTAPSAPYTRPTQRLSRPHPSKTNRCKKPYAATQHVMLLMMGLCTRNMSS